MLNVGTFARYPGKTDAAGLVRKKQRRAPLPGLKILPKAPLRLEGQGPWAAFVAHGGVTQADQGEERDKLA